MQTVMKCLALIRAGTSRKYSDFISEQMLYIHLNYLEFVRT